MTLKDRLQKLESHKRETVTAAQPTSGDALLALGLDPDELKAEAGNNSIAEIASRQLGLSGSEELRELLKAKIHPLEQSLNLTSENWGG